MARPIVALLTDFGTRDHYAGTMKGVILSLCPDVTLVDISHDVPAHDILTAALELAASYKYFPAGTIFLVVVDPGVGSARRGMAAEAGDYKFVAPDNGVLTAVFREAAPKRVVVLTERRYARPTISRTFEGRDRFAPAAAWLAKGIDITALGRAIHDYQKLDIRSPEVGADTVIGEVLRVDRFGNLVTNVDRRVVEKLSETGPVQIRIGGRVIGRLVATYADADEGELCAVFGSTGHLEVAANAANAADLLGLGRGAPIEIGRG
jgi:S-adenosylmethionine hydrolase